MAGYLLNLTFDFQDANLANALFNDNTSDATSKKWYNVPSNWPGVAVNQGAQVPVDVNGPNWPAWPWTSPTNPIDSNPLHCALQDNIYIRIAWRTWINPSPLSVVFMTTFGRTAPNQAIIASPFILPNSGGYPQTMYSNTSNQPVSGAWIFYLGTIMQNVPGRGIGVGSKGYSFIVSAHVTDAVKGMQYGHDPKIVVGGGGGGPQQ
jgi:hypothetical protein